MLVVGSTLHEITQKGSSGILQNDMQPFNCSVLLPLRPTRWHSEAHHWAALDINHLSTS